MGQNRVLIDFQSVVKKKSKNQIPAASLKNVKQGTITLYFKIRMKRFISGEE